MVRVRVTGFERRQFRSDMRDFRKISAAYTSLKGADASKVKSPSECQAALGQAKLQYDLALDKYFLKYGSGPVLENVRNYRRKVTNMGALAVVASFALATYLFIKGNPVSQENIQVFMDYFKNHAIERIGSVMSLAVMMASLVLTMPLENAFSEKPVETFRDIAGQRGKKEDA
ncbi:MAG: hypothetical protein WC861_04600 [Candidatus Micrarchaeia archaeon]|jgi:hypothetical protein